MLQAIVVRRKQSGRSGHHPSEAIKNLFEQASAGQTPQYGCPWGAGCPRLVDIT